MKKDSNKLIKSACFRAKMAIALLCIPALPTIAFTIFLGAPFAYLAVPVTLLLVIPLAILAGSAKQMGWERVSKLRIAFLVGLFIYLLVWLYFMWMVCGAFMALWAFGLIIGVLPVLFGLLFAFSAFAKARCV